MLGKNKDKPEVGWGTYCFRIYKINFLVNAINQDKAF